MNRVLAVAVVIVAVGVAAGGGYWLGQQRPGSGGDKSAAAPGQGSPATGKMSGSAGAGPGGPGAQSSGGPPPVTVEAVKVAVVAMPQGITAVGSLRSDESVTLRPEVTGRISQIAFQEGQRVAKGTVLVRLDDSVPRADAEQARANLWLAKSKAERAAELNQKGFVSAQARDDSEGALRAAQAAVQSAEARLAKTQISAPFSGIIGLRQVSVGDYVKDGQDMVNLEAIDPLKVDFRVPEVFLRRVATGQTLQINLDALPGRQFEGRVYAINPLVDAAGRSIVIRAVVRNSESTLRPGMFARLRLLTQETAESMVVPETALVPQGEDQFVYRVLDQRAQRTRVEIGQRREGKVEVLRGLAANDLVVTAGHLKVRDGSAVRVAAAPSEPPAKAGGETPKTLAVGEAADPGKAANAKR